MSMVYLKHFKDMEPIFIFILKDYLEDFKWCKNDIFMYNINHATSFGFII
jgi:hypothetical protein